MAKEIIESSARDDLNGDEEENLEGICKKAAEMKRKGFDNIEECTRDLTRWDPRIVAAAVTCLPEYKYFTQKQKVKQQYYQEKSSDQ